MYVTYVTCIACLTCLTCLKCITCVTCVTCVTVEPQGFLEVELLRAAEEGRLEDIKEIGGASAGIADLVNTTDEGGHTPLHLACDRGHTGIAAWLLAHGADVNAQNSDGQTPLHMACVCERKMVVQVLSLP